MERMNLCRLSCTHLFSTHGRLLATSWSQGLVLQTIQTTQIMPRYPKQRTPTCLITPSNSLVCHYKTCAQVLLLRGGSKV